MKNKLKLFTISAVFLFTFSCNNDENIKTGESLPYKTESSITTAKQYSNFGNPYELVGENHNLFLESLPAQSSPDLNTIVAQSINFSNQINSNINILDHISQDEIVNVVNTSLNQPFTDQIEQYHSQGKISGIVYQQLLRLADIVNSASEAEGAEALVQKIDNLEKSILLLNLNEADKPVLLSVISVAKYSSHYWLEEYNESGTINGKVKLPNWAKNIFNLGYVILADAAGAASGAVLGNWIADYTGVENKAIVQALAVVCAGAASAFAANHAIFQIEKVH